MNDFNDANPLEGLLGDLLKVISGTATNNAPWLDTARTLAHGIASDATPDANVDPLHRIRLNELARITELHVTNATGLQVSSGKQPIAFKPLNRSEWALAILKAFEPFLTRIANAQVGSKTSEGVNPSLSTKNTDSLLKDFEVPTDLTGLDDLSSVIDPDFVDGPIESNKPHLGNVGETSNSTNVTNLGFPDGLNFPSDIDASTGINELMGQFALTLGPILLGMQFGSGAGHLAQWALSQYCFPVPWPDSEELLIIPSNVAKFAKDWSLPIDEVELWICIRELTLHSVLSRKSVSKAFNALLDEVSTQTAALHQELSKRIEAGTSDPEMLQALLSDPESLLSDLVSPGQLNISNQLSALTSVINSYADHISGSIALSLTGSYPALAEAWYRYRVESGESQYAFAGLFGLDLSRNQVERGNAFIAGVIERAGEDALARLWVNERNLPTVAEVDAPGLWLERIDLPT